MTLPTQFRVTGYVSPGRTPPKPVPTGLTFFFADHLPAKAPSVASRGQRAAWGGLRHG